MRFTIEYDNKTNGTKVVPGSMEFGSMEDEGVGTELEMEAFMLKAEAMADWFAESFECLMEGYRCGDAEAAEIVRTAFSRKKNDAAFVERVDFFMRKMLAEMPTYLGKLLQRLKEADHDAAAAKDKKASSSSRELMEELASEPGNEALAKYLKMSKDREGGA